MNNLTYPIYADKAFEFFRGFNAGQGGYYFRNLLAKRTTMTSNEYKLRSIVACNLISTGYLEDSGNGFIKLTQKGFDYLQGDQLQSNVIDFRSLINLEDKRDNQFNTLWLLIGKEEEAPFYTKGSIYYDAIKGYLDNMPIDYTSYMKQRTDKELSTSRISWYRELHAQLKLEDLPLFYMDLKSALEKFYQPVVQDMENDFDWLDNNEQQTENVPVMDNSTNTVTKKTVFITYCWETDLDPNHADWVHSLANDLSDEFEVIIDIKQPLGIELNRFMEQTIANSDKVLIIATPEYKRRADNRILGVGYETSLITDDLVSEQNRIKFIPIIRKGSKEESYPRYLGSRKGLHMTDDNNYEQALQELKDNLRNF